MPADQAETAPRPFLQRLVVTFRRWRRGRSDWLQVPPEPPLLTGNAVQAVLLDVSLLLDYLNRLPETRLGRYFSEQIAQPLGTALVGVSPPCRTQTYFLGRIAAIAALGRDADTNARTEPAYIAQEGTTSGDDPAGRGEAARLGDLAFLIWSRDFLAAIAAPATLDTIRVTRAYRAARMMRRIKVREDASRESGYDDRELFMSRYGIAIARRVGWFQLLAMFLLWFSLYLSVMVYSGQVLMHENTALHADLTAFETRLREAAAQEEDLVQAALRAEPATEGTLMARGYCDTRALLRPDLPLEAVRLPGPTSAGGVPAANDAASSQAARLRLYISERQRALCTELRVLQQRESELKRVHGRWFVAARPVVYFAAPSILFDSAPRGDLQAGTLQLFRYSMQQIINGLLAGIMPAMYAALGALASLFRRLSQKANDERLGPADYSGMMSSLVLGGLTGAVIGLFVNVVPQSTQSAGLPLSTTAIALLAGYAADRVFDMFDNLADRVFIVPEGAAPARA